MELFEKDFSRRKSPAKSAGQKNTKRRTAQRRPYRKNLIAS
jgi:hypothetical protein